MGETVLDPVRGVPEVWRKGSQGCSLLRPAGLCHRSTTSSARSHSESELDLRASVWTRCRALCDRTRCDKQHPSSPTYLRYRQVLWSVSSGRTNRTSLGLSRPQPVPPKHTTRTRQIRPHTCPSDSISPVTRHGEVKSSKVKYFESSKEGTTHTPPQRAGLQVGSSQSKTSFKRSSQTGATYVELS